MDSAFDCNVFLVTTRNPSEIKGEIKLCTLRSDTTSQLISVFDAGSCCFFHCVFALVLLKHVFESSIFVGGASIRVVAKSRLTIDTIKIHGPTMLRKGSRTADQCKDASLIWSRHSRKPPVRTPELWSRITVTRSTSCASSAKQLKDTMPQPTTNDADSSIPSASFKLAENQDTLLGAFCSIK